MKYPLSLVGAVLIACCPLAGAAVGQQPGTPDPNQPQIVELLVSPAPEPRPALKHSLLPTPSERTPGNAAPHYYRAIVLQNQTSQEVRREFGEKQQAWLAAAHDDAAVKAEMGKWLDAQRSVLAEVKAGAFREYCDWDFRLQDLRGPELLSFLLPEIQECRTLARTLQIKARHEIMDGRPDDALQTLRVGYQLARDAAQPPYLISALVGVAIANIMNDELVVLMRHGDANYYWALATLPEPLIDMRPAMQFEMNMPLQIFPFLKDAETAEQSPEQWRKEIIECIQGLESISGGSAQLNSWQAELAAVALTAKIYPTAKEQLTAEGMSRDKVEAMPVGQVVAIQTSRSVKHAFHEVFKLSHLPHHVAAERMPGTLERLKQQGHLHGKFSGREGLPITLLLLPAVSAVTTAEVHLARNLAALQALEAIRMQAAVDGGKLPVSLAAVTVVPVPHNPATGEPFAYALDAAAGIATLEVPPSGGLPAQHYGKRYVIRLKTN